MNTPIRSLQIEGHGDPWDGPLKPKIRLMGHWLEQAGFKPGERVQVLCIAHGFIALRSPIPSSKGGETVFLDESPSNKSNGL
jgi:hypothetical protein